MKYVYLDDISSHVFNGGEVHIKDVDKLGVGNCEVMLIAKLRGSDDIMKLLLATDALRRVGVKDLSLTMSYVPYARQDRVCCKGEAFSLEVFANLINAQKYSEVSVSDPHSSVVLNLLDNCKVYTSYANIKSIVKKFLKDGYNEIHLVAPDKGAIPRVKDIIKCFNVDPELKDSLEIDLLSFDKVRELRTGEIIGLKVDIKPSIISGYEVCIVIDDICDGGRTFEEVGKHLLNMNYNERILFVTHGIFSKGTEQLCKYYHNIYTTNSFYNQDIKQIKVI